MPDFGFPASPRSYNLQRIISETQRNIQSTQIEAVTGRRADPARDLDGRVAELLGIEKSIDDLQDYAEIIALAEGRAGTTQTSLKLISDTIVEVAADAVVTMQSGLPQAIGTQGEIAEESLASIISALNVSFGGRTLFAGDQPDGAAVASVEDFVNEAATIMAAQPSAQAGHLAVLAEFNAAGGTFETTLYEGGTGDAPSTEVAPGERIDYGVRADDRTIRAILGNLAAMAAVSDPANGYTIEEQRDVIEAAAAELRSNNADLEEITSRLGVSEERIATAKARNIAQEAALTLSYNELAARDQFDAASELGALQGELEGLFLTTSRLSGLTLPNFLR